MARENKILELSNKDETMSSKLKLFILQFQNNDELSTKRRNKLLKIQNLSGHDAQINLVEELRQAKDRHALNNLQTLMGDFLSLTKKGHWTRPLLSEPRGMRDFIRMLWTYRSHVDLQYAITIEQSVKFITHPKNWQEIKETLGQ